MASNIEDDFVIMACGFVLTQCLQNVEVNRKKPRYWMRSLLKKRSEYGTSSIMDDLIKDDIGLNGELRSSFQNFIRMSSSDFEHLINLIGSRIQKKNTNYRNAISVKERLAITLRFIASGDSYQSLVYLCRVSITSISRIVPEVCDALCEVLRDYVKVPTTCNGWKKIADNYNNIWNFPQCVGSMDGKHIVIQSPKFSGSEFYNYKGYFSIVLFAIVDANYNFMYVYIGCQGRISDGGVFKSTGFASALNNSLLNLPQRCALPEREKVIPYVFVADDAFPLSPNIMKPYPGHQVKGSNQRLFNYRLSRARRVVENVFGILVQVFRVLRKPMLVEPEKAEKIALTCVLLHNYLRRNEQAKSMYNPPGTYDIEDIDSGAMCEGSWRRESELCESFLPVRNIARKPSHEATEIRDEFSIYFSSEVGQVPWQAYFS